MQTPAAWCAQVCTHRPAHTRAVQAISGLGIRPVTAPDRLVRATHRQTGMISTLIHATAARNPLTARKMEPVGQVARSFPRPTGAYRRRNAARTSRNNSGVGSAQPYTGRGAKMITPDWRGHGLRSLIAHRCAVPVLVLRQHPQIPLVMAAPVTGMRDPVVVVRLRLALPTLHMRSDIRRGDLHA